MSYKYNSIFQIPERNLRQQRLTKAFFLRNFDLSSAEKKTLNESIIRMEILAQILPDQSNIPSVVTKVKSYEQVLLIVCTVADNQLDSLAEKCMQLIQKYISHQLMVIVEDTNEFIINATEKRINQKDTSKLTVERFFTTDKLSKLYKNELSAPFYEALDYSKLDKTNLELFYKSYIQTIIQYQTATKIGSFKKRTTARTMEDMQNIETIEKLETDIQTLTSQIKKVSQLNEKVALNIRIQKKRQEIESIKNTLTAI